MKQVNMKRSSLILALVVLAAGSVFAQAQKPQKIGTLNMEYVLSSLPEIKSIQSSLEGLSTQLQKQGEAKQAQYQQKVVKYQSEGQTMTIGDRQALEREIALRTGVTGILVISTAEA
jgi:outer membrane protein